MPLLGSIVKSAIALKHNLTPSFTEPIVLQEEQLQKLLEKAVNTSFGLYHGFAQILQASDKIKAFRKEVPIYDYDTMYRQWWKQQQRFPNITWPGKPHYFALSSGTTGKESKRIPVTDDMLAAFRSVGIAQVESLANFDLPAELFEKDVLMLSSSADLDENNGHLEGEISGINTSNLPTWFGGF